MLEFLSLNPGMFGLDMNDLALRLVQLRRRNGRFELASYSELEIDQGLVVEGLIKDPKKLSIAIRELCRNVQGRPLNTPYVAAALPEESSFSQTIPMPQMNDQELAAALPYEMENYIPLPLEKVYFGFERIGGAEAGVASGKQKVLVSAITKSVVDSYVSCLKSSGLEPYFMEIESQAIVRPLLEPKTVLPPTIFIDFGGAKTRIIIVSANTICFTSFISPASEKLTDALSSDLRLSRTQAQEYKIKKGIELLKGSQSPAVYGLLEELASAIKKYIAFYQDHIAPEQQDPQQGIEQVVLSGGGSNLKGLPEFLADSLDLPVKRGNPCAQFVSTRQGIAIPPKKQLSFTTAIGLAMGGMHIAYD